MTTTEAFTSEDSADYADRSFAEHGFEVRSAAINDESLAIDGLARLYEPDDMSAEEEFSAQHAALEGEFAGFVTDSGIDLTGSDGGSIVAWEEVHSKGDLYNPANGARHSSMIGGLAKAYDGDFDAINA